ncbi:hypothetical protein SEA_BANTAM_125 [Gordonia phage Bantam]|uniref:Uncharacterized protein n=1 Tax=Gordonia phage Bantam TaxID=1887641 RepID=A0A1B3AYK4_9CAUD|nr:hypothetical protein BIZ77_gp054 [Gordonia phage Bantam]AOE43814.1 hypothetical protein SEA_BANTAM_125 [Gordonia phage Bantam]
MSVRIATYPESTKALLSALLTRMDGEYSVETVTDEWGVVGTFLEGRVDLSALSMCFLDELEQLVRERISTREVHRNREIAAMLADAKVTIRAMASTAAIPPQLYGRNDRG